MKKTIRLFILANVGILMSFHAYSCDVCGCGVGNYYFGIMPQYHKNFLGLRYRYRTFTSHVGESQYSQSLYGNEETFQSTEIWARFYPLPKIQVLAFIPMNFNKQYENGTGVTHNLQGLGDASLFVNYNLINNTSDTNSIVKHNLLSGGGIKLPTGKYKFDESDKQNVNNANFQLGSGSVDFMLNLVYTIRYKKVGLSTDITYKINTVNKNNYQFGNRVSGGVNLFFLQKIGEITIMPTAGIFLEKAFYDYKRNVTVYQTGGTATLGSAGVETYFKNFAIGFNFQKPISQNLSDGLSIAHDRATVHVTYLF